MRLVVATEKSEDDWSGWSSRGSDRAIELGHDWRPIGCSMCPDPIAARDLAFLISDYSEHSLCAVWCSQIEHMLWEAEAGCEIGLESVTAGLFWRLRELSSRCGGWVVWDEEHGHERWVSHETWREMREWRRPPRHGGKLA